MGFIEAVERARNIARYETHLVKDGKYSYLPTGGFKKVTKPVTGAVAEFESGTDAGGRTTLTRVAAGAIIAGPVGAIVGGMFKKDRTRVYVTTTFPDGDVIVLDGPVKDERKLRDFTAKVNNAANA